MTISNNIPAVEWLQRQETQRQLVVSDPAVSWEQCLVYGHPTHPVGNPELVTLSRK